MVDIKISFKKEALHISHFPQIATSPIPFRVVGKTCSLQSAFAHIFSFGHYVLKYDDISSLIF